MRLRRRLAGSKLKPNRKTKDWAMEEYGLTSAELDRASKNLLRRGKNCSRLAERSHGQASRSSASSDAPVNPALYRLRSLALRHFRLDSFDGFRFPLPALNFATMTAEQLAKAKSLGFSDRQIAHLTGSTESDIRAERYRIGLVPSYRLVDTCAAEFEAYTPYYYSTYDRGDDEVKPSDRKKVMILGGGPNRIGQGIEFDYCCVTPLLLSRRTVSRP
jgi:hypothetical protein